MITSEPLASGLTSYAPALCRSDSVRVRVPRSQPEGSQNTRSLRCNAPAEHNHENNEALSYET